MTKDEALLMVINWLEGGDFVYPTELLDACKEALEQPTVDKSLTVQKPLSDEEITKMANTA